MVNLFVGALSRYYSRDWMRAPDIVAWRKGLPRHGGPATHWHEDDTTACFTDRLERHAYTSLLVWAAREEHPETPMRRNPINDPANDPAVAASRAEGFRSRYGQLLNDVELWLPCETDGAYGVPHPLREKDEMVAGSNVRLEAELRELNGRTWRADEETIRRWRADETADRLPIEEGAKRAFARLLEMAGVSVKHWLPMKLDG